MALLEVLGQVVQVFTDLLPRFANRPGETQWLVVDALGFKPRTCGRPVLYVPVMDVCDYYPATEEPVNATEQSLTTADDISITADVGFCYRIYDPLKLRHALGDNYDTRAGMIARRAVRDAVSGHNFSQLKTSGLGSAVVADMEIEIDAELGEYGMELISLCIEDFVQTQNYRHYGINIGETL